jgi:hypothetical protein
MTNQICVLCGVVYTAPPHLKGYQGICPDHWNKDVLREFDRIASARGHLSAGQPDTLRLDEWMAIIAAYRGVCALCETLPFSVLELWTLGQGLTANNAVPLCRACAVHRRGSWQDAVDRVTRQLACSEVTEMEEDEAIDTIFRRPMDEDEKDEDR